MDFDFPFRLTDLGVERYHQRKMTWVPLVGTPDSSGHLLTSWVNASGRREFKRIYSIVWRLTHGSYPPAPCEISHINSNKLDNRIENLCLVSHSENMQLARKTRGNWSPRKLPEAVLEEALADPPIRTRTLAEIAKEAGTSRHYLANLRLINRLTDPVSDLSCN